MTTETMTNETTKPEELLAKSREAREARWQKQEAERAAAQAAWQQEVDKAVARIRAIIEPALGKCDFVVHDYDHNIRQFTVTPRAWKGLVKAVIEAEPGGMWKLIHPNGKCYLSELAEWESPAALESLAAMDDLFQERRADAVKVLCGRLALARDTATIMNILADLMAIAPERVDEWDALGADASERIAARAAALDAYIQALGEWRREYERILNDNRETVAGAQRALDKTFERYEVAFAAVGDDEEEPYRETAWAVEPDPEEGGYWSIFENGNIVRRRLLRPLWVGEEIVQTLGEAGAGPWRRAYYVHEAGMTVYYLPWHKVEMHRQLDKTIEPLPAEPTPPALLGDGLTAAEHERIAEVTRGMARVEIPF